MACAYVCRGCFKLMIHRCRRAQVSGNKAAPGQVALGHIREQAGWATEQSTEQHSSVIYASVLDPAPACFCHGFLLRSAVTETCKTTKLFPLQVAFSLVVITAMDSILQKLLLLPFIVLSLCLQCYHTMHSWWQTFAQPSLVKTIDLSFFGLTFPCESLHLDEHKNLNPAWPNGSLHPGWF